MKILFDQNLSPKLVSHLAIEFPGSVHVIPTGLDGATDSKIWSYARANGFVIASKDSDFKERAQRLGHPPKVIWVRLKNCPTKDVAEIFRDRLQDILAFESDSDAHFLELP